jgi:hypothetical protein
MRSACWRSSCSPTTTCRTASSTRAAPTIAANWNALRITSTSTSPGRPLPDIRTRSAGTARARSEMETLLAHTVELAEQALAPGGEDDVLLAGQTRLMGVQDLSDLDRLRDLFEAFARKREILQLLERTRARRACASSSARRAGWRRWNRSRWSPRPTAPAAACSGVLGRDRPHAHGLRPGDPGRAGRRRRPRRRAGARRRAERGPGP